MFGHVGPRFKWNGIPDPNKMYITILVVTSDCILGPGVGESNTNIHFKVSFTLPKTNVDTKNGHNKTESTFSKAFFRVSMESFSGFQTTCKIPKRITSRDRVSVVRMVPATSNNGVLPSGSCKDFFEGESHPDLKI